MLKKENELLLKSANLRPVKHRGQNFLVSEEIIKKIIETAQIKSDETILEVGPGTGNLTLALLGAGAKVIAVEKDRNLYEILRAKIQGLKFEILNNDILSFDETKIKKPYRLIANIPYYLTGPLIQKFLLANHKPSELILMVQKEVGERITAQPPRANYLSTLVQFLAETKILFSVRKENFWPQPKVDSVVIRLRPFSDDVNTRRRSLDSVNINEHIKFLKCVFKQPRQTLFNNLRKSGLTNINNLEKLFAKMKFDKNIRPQNLNQAQFMQLFESIS